MLYKARLRRSEAGRVTAPYRKALREEEQKLRQLELDNLNNRAMLEERIASGEFPLTLRPGKHSQHIKGAKYVEGKSYLTISTEEAQEIVNKYHGTGKVRINNNGTQICVQIILNRSGLKR